ncbi:MAG: spermidine synthase [Pseudorhodoplanes sp.]
MTTIEQTEGGRSGRVLSLIGLTLPVFAVTICLSALLLFSVQPMFTKMVLPLLGGSPGVWSVAMVFFQAMLLAGYAYAHGVTRLFDPRISLGIHLCVFALALLSLPLALASGFGKPPADGEALWLIGLFGLSIGLPFFAVAANAPLLQAWFARTKHPQAHDPYFLYGASNLGSFVALLAYPIAIEPFLTLRAQSIAWSAGFVVLMAMIAGAGILMVATMKPAAVRAEERPAVAPGVRDIAAWIALAFVPSAMLVAVTSHISTDIASAPFLWVVPLAIFLATFIFTFRAGGDKTHKAMVLLQPFIIAPLAIGLFGGARVYWVVILLLDLAVLAVTAMICHLELYLKRPHARFLSAFYLWISVGGGLVGIFSGLIAPYAFPDVWEYPILIVLALLCRPGAFHGGWQRWAKGGAVFAGLLAIVLLPYLLGRQIPAGMAVVWMIGLVAVATYIMLNARDTMKAALGTALVLIATALYRPGFVQAETSRSFFGVHKVADSTDGRFRMLFHGTTLHGVQRLTNEDGAPDTGKPEPLTYYYKRGPIAETIATMREQKGKLDAVAVVGLGTGSMACHARAGERWRYFEIDPVVVRLAREKFRFLSQCAGGDDIVLGDARLTLAEEPGKFDLIVLDAFSSDVVPVHLLTKEALGQYLGRLKEGGAIAFHISNRYLELASVIAEVGATHGLSTIVRRDDSVSSDETRRNMYAGSLVAVVARSDADIAGLSARPGWRAQAANGSVRPWTDDYSNILSAMWRLQTGK